MIIGVTHKITLVPIHDGLFVRLVDVPDGKLTPTAIAEMRELFDGLDIAECRAVIAGTGYADSIQVLEVQSEPR